jgi:hypothetical protein
MIVVPESRPANSVSAREIAQPAPARWIDRVPTIVTQKGDGITLNVPAIAVRPGIILNGDKKEWHSADVNAHRLF